MTPAAIRLTRRQAAAVGRRRVAALMREGRLVVAADEQIPDANGDIGAPYVVLSTLARMAAAGTITPEQLDAGERFHDLFRLAALDGLKAATLDRPSGIGGVMSTRGGFGSEHARRKVQQVIRELGGELAVPASCAWHVLGLEWSLREWAAKSLRGNVDRATGALVATLSLIETRHLA